MLHVLERFTQEYLSMGVRNYEYEVRLLEPGRFVLFLSQSSVLQIL